VTDAQEAHEMDEEAAKQLMNEVRNYSMEFDLRCQERHDIGRQRYGATQFLNIDSLEMFIEEVIDAGNYARYTYIKLRMVQEGLRRLMPSDVDGLGSGSFKKSEDFEGDKEIGRRGV
jgi:hypothetical protein